MAGCGETCSHVAATVFLLEYVAKHQDEMVGTDQLCAWLPPTLGKEVPRRTVAHMDFSSPATKLAKLQRIDQPESQDDPSNQEIPAWKKRMAEEKDEEYEKFFSLLNSCDPKSIVLSGLAGDRSDAFIPPKISDELPKVLTKLYDPRNEGLSYDDLLDKCQAEMVNVCSVTLEQRKKLEGLTRGQTECDFWYQFKHGRISTSNMKLVVCGNVDKPAISTIDKICYGGKKFYSVHCERGKKLEKPARMKYECLQRLGHEDFSVRVSGLHLHKTEGYLAASPDGLVSCRCCGDGGLEVKCPDKENMFAHFENGKLKDKDKWFYQMQTQMLVCDMSYCDLFVYCPPRSPDHILERFLPSEECHKEILEKSKLYFIFVIMPELMAKHFSLSRVHRVPLNAMCDNVTVNVCYCQTPRRDPMVTCSGGNCTFKQFHCRCVDLQRAPKKQKWFCDRCEK